VRKHIVMRKVLIITYYFPPAGGSGVHRPAAWVRHLHAHGYEALILTPGAEWHSNAARESDSLLNHSTPRIWRTTPDEPLRWHRKLRKLCPVNPEGLARCLDFKGIWARSAISAGRDILSAEPVDVILATCPPYAIAMAGRTLAREFGIPWVLDLRSPWALANAIPWKGGAGYLLDRALEYIRNADVLYLPFWWSKRIGRIIRAPSKLYEYLGARKPILSILGPGDVYDVLEKAGSATFCKEPSEAELAEKMFALYQKRNIDSKHSIDDEYVRTFSWPALVKRMASVLDKAVAVGSANCQDVDLERA